MLAVLRATLLAIAVLAAVDAALVTASLFMTDSAPFSRQVFLVSLGVSGVFLGLAWLAAALQRHLAAVAQAGAAQSEMAASAFNRTFRPLAMYLMLASILVLLCMAMLSYAILARINQNFAVFG